MKRNQKILNSGSHLYNKKKLMLSNNKIHEDAYHAVNDFSTQKVPDYTGLVVQDEKYVWVPSLIIIIIIEPMILDECYLTNLFLSAERFSD